MLTPRTLLPLIVVFYGACGESSPKTPPAGGQGGGGSSGATSNGGSTAAGTSPGGGTAGATSGGSSAQGGAGTASDGSGGSAASGGEMGERIDVTYLVDETGVFANPERGIYHHLETRNSDYSPLDAGALADFRTDEAVAVFMRVFYLDGFVDSDISSAYLSKVAADFAAARTAGVKLVVRFAYTSEESGNDATKERILAHIEQLKPLLTDNVDVIATVQAGLIGAWGEWYYTQHFGNAGAVSEQDYANRKAVADALLAAVPTSRAVQLRVPQMKRRLYGNASLTAETAFGTSPAARLGHHNDAFVADAQDMGTYLEPEIDMPFLEADSAFLPVGGENNQYQAPRTACPSALTDLARYHWSFLNTDFLAETITQWKTQGCYETMRRKLGYRLALKSAKLPTTAKVGGSATLTFELANSGFAAPYNPRGFELVLRETTTKQVVRLSLEADPRRWLPADSIELEEVVKLDDAPAGTYDLFLALPDPAPSLHDRPEYAIRLANADGWDAELGASSLKAQLTISE